MKQFYLPGVFVVILLLHLLPEIRAQDLTVAPQDRKITIAAKDPTLKEVLKAIETQTGIYFTYESRIIKGNRRVKVPLADVSLDKALRLIFPRRDIAWTYRDNVVRIGKVVGVTTAKTLEPSNGDKPAAVIPLVDVSGFVVDKNKKPVAGATVYLKGKQRKEVCNGNGAFNFMQIPANTTLEITSAGFRMREYAVVGENAKVQIVLDSLIREIAEVNIVSTGFENVRKDNVTGSFSIIRSKLLNQQVGTGFINRIIYMVSGVSMMPGGLNSSGTSTGIMVRGLSTISGPKEPLFVLNNFPYYGNVNNINPNDIESITVLKDAAAAAIWGSQAGNGVIVITTNKSKYNDPLQIVFNSNITITEKPDLFSRKMMLATDLIDVEKMLFDKDFYTARLNYPEYYALTPVVTLLYKASLQQISDADANAQIDKLRQVDVRNEFYRYFYRNTLNKQYAISISEGYGKHAWLISGGYDNNQSELNANYKRYTLQFNHRYNVIKDLEFITHLFYTYSLNKSGAPSFQTFTQSQLPPYTKFRDERGNPIPLYTYNGSYREDFLDTLGRGKLMNWEYFPLNNYQYETELKNIRALNAEFGVNYNFATYFSVTAKYQYQQQIIQKTTDYDIESFFARNLINHFSQLDYTTGVVKYGVPKKGIRDLDSNKQTGSDFRWQINFKRTFNNQHHVTAIAGGQVSEVATSESYTRKYGYDGNGYSNADIDFTKAYPVLIGGEMEKIPNRATANKTNVRYISTYLNAAYTLNNKYTVSLSGRRDATNTFGAHTKDKWKPLWSSGASWLLSDEPFFRKTRILEYVRLRVTYGKSGNVDPKKVAEATIRYQGQNSQNLPFARIDNVYNPDLRREAVKIMNGGIDFRHRRFEGSVEIYRKSVTDLFGSAPVDITAGLGMPMVIQNIGRMVTDGVDIDFSSVNSSGNIKWNSNLIISICKDRITSNNKDDWKAEKVAGSTGAGLEGYPVYAAFGYKWGGLNPETGDPRGFLDGQLSQEYSAIINNTRVEDLVYVGRRLPRVSGSLGNTIAWRNFSLNVLVFFKFDYYFSKQTIDYEALFTQLTGHADYTKRWQKRGDELHTSVPSMIYPNVESRDLFNALSANQTVRGDHIRLQYINVNYKLDKDNVRKLPFERVELYAMLNNVAMLWKANKENIDPDYPLMAAQKSISFGARFTFKKKII